MLSYLHFGLSGFVVYALYLGGIAAALLTIFWRPIIGLYYLTPLIPLQTVRYWLNDFPLGQSVIDIMVAAIILGLLRQRQSILPRMPVRLLLIVYGIYTFASLCLGSFYLHRPLPFSLSDPRLADWKSYMTMPLLMFLAMAAARDLRQMRVVILLMCLSVFLLDRSIWDTVSSRDFSNFSEDLRDEGGMGYAGVNGLAAFEAQFATALLALAAFEELRRWRLAYTALAGFSVLCLMYSLSRGGYAAFLVGWLFIGAFHHRKLLALLAVFLMCWTAIVPNAVRQRVFMTYEADRGGLEHSADTRLELWNDALEVIDSRPLIGTGFNTYAYLGRVGSYRDTHNIYLKVLVETGFLGLALFLWLLWKLWWMGWRGFRRAADPLVRSLGLAVSGWIVCTALANFFGDRWTYLQVDGYLWVLAGLLCRGMALEQEAADAPVEQTVPGVAQLATTGA